MRKLDLYLDESGSFTEHNSKNKRSQFPSQLAGLLVPGGELSKKEALKIFRRCFACLGKTLDGSEIHGYNMSAGHNYDRLITALIGEIKQRNWQAVRLVNHADIYFGGFTDYTNAIAELALRIFIEQSKEHNADILLNFYCAERSTAEGMSELYLQTIKNYIAFAAMRRGISVKSSRWRIGKLQIIPAKNSRQLQICDLLSNSSYGEYQKCGAETRKLLHQAFGNYNATMVVHREIEQCDRFIASGSLGLAIEALADILTRSRVASQIRQQTAPRLESILNKLTYLAPTERDLQLQILTLWLEQLIEQQRFLERGIKIANWLQKQVHKPLYLRLKNNSDEVGSLEWFEYSINYWLLVAHNYVGNSLESQKLTKKLVKLLPAVTQWEHTNLVMSALIADAVHRTNCMEYDTAAVQIKLVIDYFDRAIAFKETFPEIFRTPTHSPLTNKALTIWLQNEIQAAGLNPARLDRARYLSQCLLDNPGEDRVKQLLYRTQIEVIAKNFVNARKYLAQSLYLAEHSHDRIAIQIKELTGYTQSRFTLLHWLRLGTTAYLWEDLAEWTEFLTALKRSHLLDLSWCKGTESGYYPAYGILRRVALIELSQGKTRITALAKLRNFNPPQLNITLAIVRCAAMAEAAAILWKDNNIRARKILNCGKRNNLGLWQLLRILTDDADKFSQVTRLTRSWLQVVEAVLTDGKDARKRLLMLGQQINY